MLKHSTAINQSPKKFQTDIVNFEEQPKLESKDEYEKVSVNIKVLKVLDPIIVPTGKKLRNC